MRSGVTGVGHQSRGWHGHPRCWGDHVPAPPREGAQEAWSSHTAANDHATLVIDALRMWAGVLAVLLAICSAAPGGAPPALVIDPPTDALPRAAFDVHVRPAGGGEWQPLPAYFATSMSKLTHAAGGAEGFVTFAFEGAPVDVRLTLPAAVKKAVVRPVLRGAPVAAVDGRTVTFRMNEPRYLVVEVNYLSNADKTTPRFTAYVLADAPDRDAPRPDAADVKLIAPGRHTPADLAWGDKRVLCLAPGVHEVEGGKVALASGKTLYLAGGAVLKAGLVGDQVEDAAVRGRGILDGSALPRDPGDWRSDGEQGFVFLRRGRRITIDGPVIYNSPYWNIVAFGTANLTIRNHKALTWKVNNDGVQPRSVSDLLVEHCFLKCADDCIAVKTRRAAALESRRLVFRDLVLWNDLPGNPMEIGHTSQADLLSDVLFEKIAVVHGESEKSHTISMAIIDHSTVENVRYHDITVEGIKCADFGLRVETSRYTSDPERGRIRGVEIRDYVSDAGPQGGKIKGFNAEHLIENVTIRNFVTYALDPARRHVVTDLAELKLDMAFTKGVRVEP